MWLGLVAGVALVVTLVALPTAPAGRSTIRGYVTDVDGVPLKGITVHVSAAEGVQRNTETRPNGEYEIRNVPPGGYTVGAELRNGLGMASASVIGPNQTVTVDLQFPRGCLHEPDPLLSVDLPVEQILTTIDAVAHVRTLGVNPAESLISNHAGGAQRRSARG